MIPLVLYPSKFILSVFVVLDPTVPKLLMLPITRNVRMVAVPAEPSLVPEIKLAPLSITILLTVVVPFSFTTVPVLMVTVGVELVGSDVAALHDVPS